MLSSTCAPLQIATSEACSSPSTNRRPYRRPWQMLALGCRPGDDEGFAQMEAANEGNRASMERRAKVSSVPRNLKAEEQCSISIGEYCSSQPATRNPTTAK